MTRPFRALGWTTAAAAYVLIVLGAVVRISGSGLGCGDEWPVCHGRLIPALSDTATLIEWSHRLVAAIVSTLVTALVAFTWWLRKKGVVTVRDMGGERDVPGRAGYVALSLLVVQVLLGAITVRLHLPPWTVILHLGTAMALLATLLVAARGPRVTPRSRPAMVAAAVGFITVLLGALTANLGATTACTGFPLCNGQLIPEGHYLQYIQWTHRVLAYGLFGYLLIWAWRSRRRGPAVTLGIAALQIAVAAMMILRMVPKPLQAAHAAIGAALWAALVIVARPEERRGTA